MTDHIVAAGIRIIAASAVFAVIGFPLSAFLQGVVGVPEILVIPIVLAATFLVFVLYYYWTE